MIRLLIVLTITLAVGCISAPDKKKIEEAVKPPKDSTGLTVTPVEDSMIVVEGCYMQVLKRDTFTASLQQQGNLVTGKLHFDNYEKDGSSGTVSGKLEGDLLKLYYFFTSEGMNSVMELYFRYKDGMLIRGIGEMNTKGDTAYFVNPALVKYDGGELKRISCETFAGKYR